MPGTVSEVSATLVDSTILRPGRGWKIFCCSAGVSRAYSGSTSVWRRLAFAQHLRGVADLPLAGEEHQHVAGPLADLAFVGGDLVEGGEDALVHRQVVLDPVALLVVSAASGRYQVSTG